MSDGTVRSPGTGTVIEILVAVGSAVTAGDEVAVVESMKVEIPIVAETAGTVLTVTVTAGGHVEAGQVLLTIA